MGLSSWNGTPTHPVNLPGKWSLGGQEGNHDSHGAPGATVCGTEGETCEQLLMEKTKQNLGS